MERLERDDKRVSRLLLSIQGTVYLGHEKKLDFGKPIETVHMRPGDTLGNCPKDSFDIVYTENKKNYVTSSPVTIDPVLIGEESDLKAVTFSPDGSVLVCLERNHFSREDCCVIRSRETGWREAWRVDQCSEYCFANGELVVLGHAKLNVYSLQGTFLRTALHIMEAHTDPLSIYYTGTELYVLRHENLYVYGKGDVEVYSLTSTHFGKIASVKGDICTITRLHEVCQVNRKLNRVTCTRFPDHHVFRNSYGDSIFAFSKRGKAHRFYILADHRLRDMKVYASLLNLLPEHLVDKVIL